MKTRVVIADDHTIVRHGLMRLLEQEEDLEVVGEAQNGQAALELVRELAPDIVVIDVGMPELNGIDAARQILRENAKVKVLALSMHAGKKFVMAMLKAGASGYLLKDCALEELTTALRTIAAGKTYLSASITNVVIQDYVHRSPGDDQSAFSVLSQREREVLQLLAEGNTTKQIARQLHISPKTVEGHRVRLMAKLDIDNVAQLTKYAIQEGLTSAEP